MAAKFIPIIERPWPVYKPVSTPLTDLVQTKAFLKEMNVGTVIHISKDMYANRSTS